MMPVSRMATAALRLGFSVVTAGAAPIRATPVGTVAAAAADWLSRSRTGRSGVT